MITLLSSRGFTEGGPCYVVFCHLDRVFLPEATDPVLLIPGAKQCCLAFPVPNPFSCLLPLCQKIKQGSTKIFMPASPIMLYTFLDWWIGQGGWKQNVVSLGLIHLLMNKHLVWSELSQGISCILQKGTGLTDVLWNIYQLCRYLSHILVYLKWLWGA